MILDYTESCEMQRGNIAAMNISVILLLAESVSITITAVTTFHIATGKTMDTDGKMMIIAVEQRGW